MESRFVRQRKQPKHLEEYDDPSDISFKSSIISKKSSSKNIDGEKSSKVNSFEAEGTLTPTDDIVTLGNVTGPIELETAMSLCKYSNKSLHLDWYDPSSRHIGSLCKIYWEGDCFWYLARILSYRAKDDLYFLYYVDDKMAEWTRLSDEATLFAEEVVDAVVKGHPPWPAIRYSCSSKAHNIMSSWTGYMKDSSLVWFLGSDNKGDYAFIKPSAVSPFRKEYHKRPSKKLQEAISQADHELSAKLEILQKIFRDLSHWLDGTKPETCVGLRILLLSSGAVFTVACFSPVHSAYLLVFDDPDTRPEWLSADKITPEQTHYVVGDLGRKLLVANTESSTGGGSGPSHELCCLCGRITNATSQRIIRCRSCDYLCHHDCLPNAAGLFAARDGESNGDWQCWDCQSCSVCAVSSWTETIASFDLRNLFPEAAEEQTDLCATCRDRYRCHLNYCPVCYKLWHWKSDRDEPTGFPRQAEGKKKRNEKAAVEEGSEFLTDRDMVGCSACDRWVHSICEGMDLAQYKAVSQGTHPVWGDEYLCPLCRAQTFSQVLLRLQAEDHTKIFAVPVDVRQASHYYEVIRNPMDLSSMEAKIQSGQYRSLQSLRSDAELMCLNALVFNPVGDEYWKEAHSFFPRMQAVFDKYERVTHPSAYAFEAFELINKQSQRLKEIIRSSSAAVTHKRSGREARLSTASDESRPVSVGRKRVRRLYEPPPLSSSSVVVKPAQTKPSASKSSTAQTAKRDQAENSKGLDVPPAAKASPLHAKAADSSHAITSSDLPVTLADHSTSKDKHFSRLVTARCEVLLCDTEECRICGSGGASDCILHCVDCGDSLHSFCCGDGGGQEAPLAYMTKAVIQQWRCPTCRRCEVCGHNSSSKTHRQGLLRCRICDKAFHGDCLDPIHPHDLHPGACDVTASCIRPLGDVCDSFVCPDCLQCEACGLSGRAGKGWGLARDTCIRCSGRAAEVLSRPSPADEATGSLEEGRESAEDWVRCQACGSASYYAHLSAATDGIVLDVNNFLCELCIAFFRDSDRRTHLGTGDDVWKVLRSVAEIQSSRRRSKAQYEAQQLSAVDDMLREMGHLVIPWLCATIQWACRILKEQVDQCRKVGIVSGIFERCVNERHRGRDSRVWTVCRAARFYRLWSRICDRSDASAAAAELSNGNYFDLVRRCTMAAAYIALRKPSSQKTMAGGAVCITVPMSHFPPTDIINALFAWLNKEGMGYASIPPLNAIGAKMMEFVDGVVTEPISFDQQTSVISDLRTAAQAAGLLPKRPRLLHSAQLGSASSTSKGVSMPAPAGGLDSGIDTVAEAGGDSQVAVRSLAKPLKYVALDFVSVEHLKSLPSTEDGRRTTSEHFVKRARLHHVVGGRGPPSLEGTVFGMVAEAARSEAAESSGPSEMEVEDPEDVLSSELPQETSLMGDEILCAFCSAKVTPAAGRLLPLPMGGHVHVNCCRWASGVTERSGVLVGVTETVRRSRTKSCFCCGKNGAGLFCTMKSCKRVFHFPCAVAIGCKFSEGIESQTDAYESTTAIQTFVACPEHTGYLSAFRRLTGEWTPCEPMRSLRIEQDSFGAGAQAVLLAQAFENNKKSSAVLPIRCGAVTVIRLGLPSSGADGKYSLRMRSEKGFLLPVGYRSVRVHWSATRPHERTLYLFEILRLEEDAGAEGPTGFRLVAMDASEHVLMANSIAALFAEFTVAVRRVNSESMQHLGGLDDRAAPFKFFGLALAPVHQALEILLHQKDAVLVGAEEDQPYVPLYCAPAPTASESAAHKGGSHGSTASGSARSRGVRVKEQEAVSLMAGKQPEPPRRMRKVPESAPLRWNKDSGAADQSELKQRYAAMASVQTYSADPSRSDRVDFSRSSLRVEARKSAIHGWGLFALVDIPKDALVIEYLGELIRNPVADRREAAYEEQGVGSCYLFRLDKCCIIDATKTGSIARFVNHCCDPSAYAVVLDIASESNPATLGSIDDRMIGGGGASDKHILIVAARDIRAGEEITYDYKFAVEDAIDKKLTCNCGAAGCSGFYN